MLSRIDHVGIAVHDLEQAIQLYEARLGLKVSGRERLESDGIEVAMLPVGDSRIELLSPTRPDSMISKFLRERGEAVHHVAYLTDDVAMGLQRAGSAGAELLDEEPRPGAHGSRVGFIHPKSACGVLTELVQSDGITGA